MLQVDPDSWPAMGWSTRRGPQRSPWDPSCLRCCWCDPAAPPHLNDLVKKKRNGKLPTIVYTILYYITIILPFINHCDWSTPSWGNLQPWAAQSWTDSVMRTKSKIVPSGRDQITFKQGTVWSQLSVLWVWLKMLTLIHVSTIWCPFWVYFRLTQNGHQIV